MTLQNIGFGLEALGLFRGHEYRAAARHVYATAVAQKRGGGYERLVAGIEQGGHAQVQRFGDARRDDDFGFRGVVEPVFAFQLAGHFLPQFKEAVIGGVVNLPVVDGLLDGFVDVRRGEEVRAAHDHVDDVLPGALSGFRRVEKGAEAGKGDVFRAKCELHCGLLEA